MFQNIGGKIKTVAAVFCWISIAISVILGLVLLANDSLLGLLLMFVGPLFSWIGSFLLYGFGQLIENTDKLVQMQTPASNRPAPSDGTISRPDTACTPPVDNEKLQKLQNWLANGLITEEEYLEAIKKL